MKYLSILYMFIVVCSCNNSRQENRVNPADTIFVLYYVKDIETSVRLTKENIARYAEKTKIEEIIPLKDEEYEQIKNLIIACHTDSTNQKYDSRILLGIDTFQMCLP